MDDFGRQLQLGFKKSWQVPSIQSKSKRPWNQALKGHPKGNYFFCTWKSKVWRWKILGWPIFRGELLDMLVSRRVPNICVLSFMHLKLFAWWLLNEQRAKDSNMFRYQITRWPFWNFQWLQLVVFLINNYYPLAVEIYESLQSGCVNLASSQWCMVIVL